VPLSSLFFNMMSMVKTNMLSNFITAVTYNSKMYIKWMPVSNYALQQDKTKEQNILLLKQNLSK